MSAETSVPITLDQFRRAVCDALVQQSYAFRSPKHDWIVCQLWVQNEDGVDHANVSKVVTATSGGHFLTAEEKNLARDVVRRTIAAAGAYRYALVTNTHLLDSGSVGGSDELERITSGSRRLETFAQAVEALTMALGDAEDEQVWFARILRDRRRLRRVGEWTREPEIDWRGRFVNVNDLLRAPRERVTSRQPKH